MKIRWFLTALSFSGLFLPVCSSFAQDVKKVIEPEYQSVFLHLDQAEKNLVPLERQTPSHKNQAKFASSEKLLEIKGEKSRKRFSSGQSLEFVVRAPSQQKDPQSFIQYFKLEPKKGKRQLVLGRANAFGTSNKSTVGDAVVAFDAAKYGESSFKIKAIVDLPPGEYCVSTSDTGEAFCFGVDPKADSANSAPKPQADK